MAQPKTKPAVPTTPNVEYFFCDNPFCNYHASFLLGKRPQEAGLVAGGTCPQCHKGKITQFNLAQASSVPLVPESVGVVLPALPYGGLSLRIGDKDADGIWAGQVVSEPQHQGAQYVRELQRDLLRLAFYGPARGGETPGVFSTMLMGGVLDFKRHLVDFYGVPASADLNEVVSKAVTAMLAERFSAASEGGTPTLLPAPAAPIQPTVPIFYPAGGLANPNEVYNPLPGWITSLGAPEGGVGTVATTLEKYAALWEKTNVALAKQASAAKPSAQVVAAIAREVKQRDGLQDLVIGTLRFLVNDVNRSRSAAELINAAPTTGPADKQFEPARVRTIAAATQWTRTSGPGATPSAPSIKPGTLAALQLRMDALEARWQSLSPPLLPPVKWAALRDLIDDLSEALTVFRDTLQSSSATSAMGKYLKLLQDFSQVDIATARYIRRMATDGVLGTIPVFRTPTGLPKGATGPQELVEFVSTDQAALKAELDIVVAESDIQLADAPQPIINYIFRHESGGSHNAVYGDRAFVKLGIDWNNQGDRSFFNPNTTSGKRPSFSRGWGVSQKTTFNEPLKLQLADTSSGTVQPGPQATLQMNAGIPFGTSGGPSPIPLFMASGVEAARSGMRIYLTAFKKATQKARQCTFRQRHNCTECVKNLNLGSPKLDAKSKPVVKGGMRFFNEAEGDFARVSIDGDLISHRFSSLPRVQALLAPRSDGPPLYAIPGKTAATVGDDDCQEFPCSWLTAVTRYAGKGEIAWYYPMSCIFTLQTGKM